MAIEDFLNTYQQSLLQKKLVNPLSGRNTSTATNPQLGIRNPKREIATTPSFGSSVPEWLTTRTTDALNRYMTSKGERTSDIAADYADKAAGQIPTNEWGIVQDKMTNFSDFFNKQLQAVDDIGKAVLGQEEAKARWQEMQRQAEMNAGYNIQWTNAATAGASGNNAGAKAVSIAMQAQGTPYAWGGNSLTRGVDCSGLVQQVYKKLGINVPRTTYEQAKHGKVVSMGSLLPGDLVFYNTGGRDPNGIGSLSHVGIYIGNGQIIHSPGRGRSVTVTSINNPGSPARAVRPW
ncbi:C40 family peptidase [Streptomyces rochei]|uniref:C40 family peptidase n=1 Tax=Streptomyces rochei TaxID=1928 RepID=UPI0036BF1C6A